MKKTSLLMIAAAFAATGVFAQQAVTEASAIKGAYNGIKNNMLKAAEKMPEDGYSFKATPDIRTFAQILAHAADSTGRGCAAMAGSTPPAAVGDKTAKADVLAGLKAAFDTCDTVVNSLTDEQLSKPVSMGRGGARPLSVALWGSIVHDNELYGYMSVYMRLKGVVPPSSEPRGGR
jgi:hypothetical protein